MVENEAKVGRIRKQEEIEIEMIHRSDYGAIGDKLEPQNSLDEVERDDRHKTQVSNSLRS